MLKSNDYIWHIWCAIPVYNNKDTVKDIAAGCREIIKNIVVVDDGSTDINITELLSDLDVVILRHEKNFGKGQAILTASRYVEEQGGTYMITIDADGQHYPDDIKRFLPLIKENGTDLIIGCRDFNVDNVPGKSRFGRKFANFWLRIETGIYINDCQSGFRAYPVKYLNQLKFKGSHYDFEAEVLAKAVWAGLQLKTVDINVSYPKPEHRVTSFKPFLDNLRISKIHTMLVGRSLLPWRHKRLIPSKKFDFTILKHPGKLFKTLLKENATPGGLAMSAAIGAFFAILPLIFIHTAIIIYVSTRLNLNKVISVNVQHFFMPPVVPAICIQVGFYLRHGKWLTELSFETVFVQFSGRLYEWFLGSLIIAPIGAILMGSIFFLIAMIINKRLISAQVNNNE